jgi:hypothetical protein
MNTDSLRRSVYALLITIAVAAIIGRILALVRVYEPSMHRADPGQTAASVVAPLAASNPLAAAAALAASNQRWQQLDPDDFPRVWPRTRPEPMPTLGANDRSRWATVRALVDEGTYVIGYRESEPKEPLINELNTLGLFFMQNSSLGITIASKHYSTTPKTVKYRDYGIVTEDGWQTIDMVLHPDRQVFLSSKPPLYSTLVAGGYWLVKNALGWSITENRWLVIRTLLVVVNVLPFVFYLALLGRLADRLGSTDWGRLYVVAAACFGTFLTTFAVTLNNHLPAAYCALFALYPALLIWSGEDRRPAFYLLAGFFAALTACFDLTAASFAVFLFALLLWRTPGRTLTFFVPAAVLPVAAFFITNYLAVGLWRPAYSEFGGPWYDYAGSHWNPPLDRRRGVDWAGQQEGLATYAINFLVGHHGVFSLSPIWLLAVIGMIAALVRGRAAGLDSQKLVAGLTLALTVIVLAFYLSRPERMRNYGGFSSGPRWLFWLIPLWLVSLLPVADWLGRRRWGRAGALLFLSLSVLSVSFPAWNPWRHPWIYQLIETRGWIRY